MGVLESAPSALFSHLDPSGPLEAALLLRRTGSVIASWTRADVPSEVVSVMAATMLGSIETMGEALGCPSPAFVVVETDRCQLVATKVEPLALLVLIAHRDAGKDVLQRTTREILKEIAKATREERLKEGRPLSPAPRVRRSSRGYKLQHIA